MAPRFQMKHITSVSGYLLDEEPKIQEIARYSKQNLMQELSFFSFIAVMRLTKLIRTVWLDEINLGFQINVQNSVTSYQFEACNTKISSTPKCLCMIQT